MESVRHLCFRRWICGLFLLALFPLAVVRAEVNPLSCLPQETGLAVRLNLKQAISSPLGSEFMDAFGDKYAAICDFSEKVFGFDFSETRSIWLISPKPNVNALFLQVPVIADDVRRTFGAVPEVTVLDNPGCPFAARFYDKKENKTKLGAVLDDGTILVGDEEWAQTVLDTWLGRHPKRNPKSPELEWLAGTSATAAAVFVGGPARWPDFNPYLASLISDMRAAATIDDGIEVRLLLTLKNPGTAEGAAQVAQGVLTLLKSAPPPKRLPRIARLALANAEVGYDGKIVQILTRITHEQISDLLAARRGARPVGVPAAGK